MRSVKVVSLNIQHGWNSEASVPLSMSRKSMLENLDNIAELLRRHSPDIVLLQEVDHTSPLSRKIDQLDYIAKKVGYLHKAHGASSELKIGRHVVYAAGCGIMSRFPIIKKENVKFDHTFPTPRKGFLVATLALSTSEKLTVVSAHLPAVDILNMRGKRAQIDMLVKTLRGRGSVIIGGDLNSCLSVLGRRNIKVFAHELNVRTHRAVVDRQLATYPAWNPTRKLDWIFASPDIAMRDYTVLPERVSDHLAVGTTVTF